MAVSTPYVVDIISNSVVQSVINNGMDIPTRTNKSALMQEREMREPTSESERGYSDFASYQTHSDCDIATETDIGGRRRLLCAFHDACICNGLDTLLDNNFTGCDNTYRHTYQRERQRTITCLTSMKIFSILLWATAISALPQRLQGLQDSKNTTFATNNQTTSNGVFEQKVATGVQYLRTHGVPRNYGLAAVIAVPSTTSSRSSAAFDHIAIMALDTKHTTVYSTDNYHSGRFDVVDKKPAEYYTRAETFEWAELSLDFQGAIDKAFLEGWTYEWDEVMVLVPEFPGTEELWGEVSYMMSEAKSGRRVLVGSRTEKVIPFRLQDSALPRNITID
ncbi:uncharacterized protein KY384_005678 [Bacidia gigantensis]|uniref:uncharacterized protein n=1 Tax=Bacidia gigantensis TaxID=2732470 RepID=UPI001D036470|nr:uncharacterized protein KY384_005678 [Bacidia gigantensis]KAG8529044.1 hypothetical protein KY384_005678 [Bacidia gigantensis]